MTYSASSALDQQRTPDATDGEMGAVVAPSLFSAGGLESLYRASAAGLVRRFARRVGLDEASDVVQEAFAKLAGAAPLPSKVVCPEAFVTTVATNVLRDRARAAARRALQDCQLALEPQHCAPDPHRTFESREALVAVEGALAEMNPRRRQIFILHRFDEMTYAEIGSEVGMSEKGVKKQIAKALVALRRAADQLP